MDLATQHAGQILFSEIRSLPDQLEAGLYVDQKVELAS